MTLENKRDIQHSQGFVVYFAPIFTYTLLQSMRHACLLRHSPLTVRAVHINKIVYVCIFILAKTSSCVHYQRRTFISIGGLLVLLFLPFWNLSKCTKTRNYLLVSKHNDACKVSILFNEYDVRPFFLNILDYFCIRNTSIGELYSYNVRIATCANIN